MRTNTELIEKARTWISRCRDPYALIDEVADALEAAEAELTRRELVIREVPTVVSSMIDDSLFDDEYSYDGILTELRARLSVSGERLGWRLNWTTEALLEEPTNPLATVRVVDRGGRVWRRGRHQNDGWRAEAAGMLWDRSWTDLVEECGPLRLVSTEETGQ